MLKFETNEIPAGLESYYEDTGTGVFKLKVDGVVPVSEAEQHKSKLKEFRDTNINLKKQVEELARFEQMFKSGEFSSEKLSAKIEEQALVKAAEMKAAYEQQVAELTEKLTGTSTKLEQIVRDNAVSAAALKHGVSETALEDVHARAKAAFKVVDGELVAADGVLDAKGKALTVDGWMAALAEKAPHLFNASRGAGATKPNRPVPAVEKKSAVDLISAGLAKRR
jgi:hypothetical protein